MEEIWNYIEEITNKDCMYLIQDKYYNNNKMDYCINQIKNIIKEQKDLIIMFEKGSCTSRPIYIKYKYILDHNRNKIRLNSKTIFVENGCFECRRHNKYIKKRCCYSCGICRKSRCHCQGYYQ
jgi:hypothetical protein